MKKILIVDDSVTIANAMQRFRAAAGYEVDTRYESGTFFDDRVTTFDPDLLILDINMPYFGKGRKTKNLFACQDYDVFNKNF